MVEQLTPEEIAALEDTRFLQLKQQVSEKVITCFSEIERALHQQINQQAFRFPEGTFLKAGKFSKGEQYQNLPYFILDYPRLFTSKEVFAFRTMLWWGHHLSCTLHLAGPILQQHQQTLIDHIPTDQNLYFCVNESPWEYHYEKDNYLKMSELDSIQIETHLNKYGFLKISDYIPVSHWDQFKSFTLDAFARFLRYF